MGDKGTYGKSPLISMDQELGQASLDPDTKTVANYFNRLNQVRADDNRYSPLNVFKEYYMFDFIGNPSFISRSYDQTANVTYDGVTINEKTFKVLFKNEFFLSDDIIVHTRIVNNLLDMISNFGGLAGLLYKVFLAVAGYIDEKLLFSKFIRSLYFKKTTVPGKNG